MLVRLFLFGGVMCWVLPFMNIGGVQMSRPAMLITGAVLLAAAGIIYAIQSKRRGEP